MTPEAENARLRQQIRDLEQQLAQVESGAGRSLRNGVNLDRSSAEPFNSESLFRAYVEAANDMVYAVDLLGRLAFINPYGERLLGLEPGEWRGRPYMDFVAPAFQQPTGQAFANLLTTGELMDFEFALVDRAGQEIHMQVNGRLLHCDGELIGGLGIARDITDRKRAEQQVQMFVRALESTHDSTAIADLQGQLIYTNRATDRVFGWTADHERSTNAAHFYPEAGAKQVAWLVEQAIGGGWSGEVICQRQDGRQFPALVSVGPVPDEQGRPVAFSIVTRDISDQKQTQAELAAKNLELERASQLKSAFLANMSHELRTPLTAILGFSSLLKQQLYGPLNEKQAIYVEQIRKSGDHLLSLINDVLDLSKIEAGQIELTIEPIDVPTLCDSALALVSQQAADREIRISKRLPRRLSRLMADEVRVRQMLLNLLSNAIKFSHEGSEIGLEAIERGGYVHLSVWDRGIGIPPEAKDLLFRPFHQLDNSLSRRHQGTGLGLALTRQLAELHGGTVDFESQLGQGSIFTIRLPLKFVPPERSPVSKEQPGASAARVVAAEQARPPQILVVEDDPTNAKLLQDVLGGWGCGVAIATNGWQAIDWLDDHPVDLVLLDIQLPDMDGLAVLEQIRQDDRWQQLPVVAATALAMDRDRQRCLDAGMQGYLSKPLNEDALRATLMELTGYTPRSRSRSLEPVD
ncbi:MAG: PAS domain S-box protein [Oscillatoriales cyanobacterium]|nr:MAG: PAS domain S-box protein [Oscillatoriales cyanobacterium]